MSKLFVSNLDRRVTNQDLEHQFSKYGHVKHVELKRNRQGYMNGFISFKNQRDAEHAKQQTNEQYFQGYRLKVDYAYNGKRGGMGGERKCFKCGGVGHSQAHCTEKNSSTSEEPVAEPESTTTEEEPAEPEPEKNGDSKTEEENGNGHADEAEEDSNGHVEETEEEETTLKRKDAPTEVEADSPKKKKLVDSEEKEPEPAAVEA